MSEQQKETTIFELADQFIALANELAAQEQDVGKVGTALRFAAARFNAFEASLKTADLATEKQAALEWFTNEYQDMLNDNLDDHIDNPPQAAENEAAENEPAQDEAVQVYKG
ncbi:DUF3144 domain-containing protein [Shewanella sp. AS1]|uniref:DUF3144 domain-containing protein n=1 Tax=Shewanella sp. AS1 TaxID=2907626 RepID=UPI001F3A35D9|nr:DUF3144 domain-containing protein [Shewanella sp. AS1]MCE9679370.1 DUF3144 domain-containing protein [Shewanella sp. AS1]